ncbi:MAG: helix-hairpin-helix domain-containing protein [Candidatus Eisenbacteria bacterium]|nr:helix-hairpin-helix domain-containing protein [Candidatus Eisenbacteria bacterium]
MASRRVDPSLMAPESGPLPDSVAAVAPAAEPPAWPVDVNRATAEELEALPGIGPARAAAIVALRERRGGLGSLEDLLDVKGIGPKTLERLRPFAVAGSRADSSRGAGAGTAPGEGRT